MKDDLIHTACALSIFTLFSMNATAQDSAPGNPAEPNEYKRQGQMTMSLSIPLSQPEQASSKADKPPQVLSAKEQEVEALNAQISQMQALIKNLQTSLKQVPDANSSVPATASEVPVSTVPASLMPVSAAPAIPAVSLKKGLQSKIWILLLAAATILWFLKNKAAKNRGVFEEVDEEARSHVGASSIKTPAYVENQNDAADLISKSIGLPASLLHRKQTIKPAEVDSMIEEAELYAIHGHLNNAMEILNNIILQYPERIEVWLLLLSMFRGNARQFEVIARKFLQTFGRNDTWREVQEAGRSTAPENPLYFDPDTPHIKPNRRRLLGNILVDMQALSGNDLENNLRHFDHLRDGRLGRYLVESGLINQSQLDEALQIQNKESPKLEPPAKRLLANLGRPRSISDLLVRMGAVTEPELEHVLADFDPKQHGHCGNYLVSCGLITQKQLYSALLQQLSGVMEEAETGHNHAARAE